MFISLQWLKNVACGVFARRNCSKKRQPKHALARIEGLEDRSMLSASIVIANGSAQVADPGDTVDALHFDFKGSPKITHIDVAATPQSTVALTNLHLFAGTVDIGFEISKAEQKLLKKSGGTVRGTVPESAPDGGIFQYTVSAFTPVKPRQKITVTGGPSSTFTVDAPTPAANLFVTQAVGTFGFQYLLDGTLEVPIQGFDFHAVGANEAVNGMVFMVPSAATSVVSLELYHPNAASAFASATAAAFTGTAPNGYTGFFAPIDDLTIVNGTTETVLVRPLLKSAAAGGISNELIQVDLLGTIASVSAVDVDSGAMIAQNDGDGIAEGEVFIGTSVVSANHNILGNPSTTVYAELDYASPANPDPNFSPVPIGVSAVNQTKFTTVINVNDGVVAINKLLYTMTTSNIAIDTASFRVYNKADASVKVAATTVVEVVPGAYAIAFDNLALSQVETRMASGEDDTFVLEVNILNPKVDNSLSAGFFTSVSLTDFGYHWVDTNLFEYQGTDKDPKTILNPTYVG